MPRNDERLFSVSQVKAGGYLECLVERGCDLQWASSLSEIVLQPCFQHTVPALSDLGGTSYVFFWKYFW